MNDVVTDPARVTRRDFIRVVTASGLALMVTLPPSRAQQPPARPAGPVREPSAFILIGTDGRITITTPAVEMGQGAHTAMPMIVMEELGGDWSRLAVKDAPAAAAYNNPMNGQQRTVGSFSVRGWYDELRRVGAAAREMLVLAAANRWSVPAGDCTVSNSVITHAASGRRLEFAEVAAEAARLPVPQNPALKAATQFDTIGTFKPRSDVPPKVDGSAIYGIDVRLPDMVYASVKACPTFGGKLKSFDDSAAKQVSGYIATVPLEDAVVVVARSFWQAKKAVEQVKAEYELGKLAGVDSNKISASLRAKLDEPGTVVRNDGDVQKAFDQASEIIDAVYEVPYLAHACMEPMNCVASVSDEACEIWCGTQAPQAAQQTAAALLGIPNDRVNVHVTYLGGGFGRRGETDYVGHAVAAAKAVRRPVKLIWTREEDIQHDFYRPASTIRFRAGIEGNRLAALESTMVTAAAPGFGGPRFTTGGLADAAYQIPNFRVSNLNADIGVRFGFWRSVNHSHNPFMLESFIDEIAHRVRQDPYQFRRALLSHEQGQRQLRVLDVVAAKSGWGKAPKGRYQGITAFESYGSYIGAVAEVSAKGKQITLHRVVLAIDCGVAVYPDNIHAQLIGGMVYGLAAALRGEITLDNGAVQQSNFQDYPMLLMAEMPTVETHIVSSTAAPGGVGEPGTAPIAPALANAIYAATGERVRSLPLSKQGYEFAFSRA